jgi:hypothetical protein
MKRTIALVCLTALAVGSVGTAVGAKLMTGGDIKNRSITQADIKKRTLGLTRLKQSAIRSLRGGAGTPNTPGSQGEGGPPGPQGAPGQNGANGTNGSNAAAVVGPQWGAMDRNTIKSPISELRDGPFVPGANGSPPFGQGSLRLVTGDGTEKASFGNEVDFQGDLVDDLDEVGFHVYTTGENSGKGSPNMPSITLEVDPNGAGGTTTSFSSLVFIPAANSTSNQWSGYIDATEEPAGLWGLSGSQFNSPATEANCGINGPRCSFDEVKTLLASGTGATIYTVGVSKGRDFEWQGAVDGLRINGDVFDFESYGVNTLAP